jgi:hypothetical protein
MPGESLVAGVQKLNSLLAAEGLSPLSPQASHMWAAQSSVRPAGRSFSS